MNARRIEKLRFLLRRFTRNREKESCFRLLDARINKCKTYRIFKDDTLLCGTPNICFSRHKLLSCHFAIYGTDWYNLIQVDVPKRNISL